MLKYFVQSKGLLANAINTRAKLTMRRHNSPHVPLKAKLKDGKKFYRD